MGTQYYVVLGDERVEGPFPTKREARRRAAELTTNEVGLNYRVRVVQAGD